jgi:hypothetical protein
MAEWLWRVTQAISFFVQRGAFSWALPAGVRIPLYSLIFARAMLFREQRKCLYVLNNCGRG